MGSRGGISWWVAFCVGLQLAPTGFEVFEAVSSCRWRGGLLVVEVRAERRWEDGRWTEGRDCKREAELRQKGN